jgi:hypothetical protein
MKKIAVLIDYTEGSKIALSQSILLAQKLDAGIVALNIVQENENMTQAEIDLNKFLVENSNGRVSIETSIGTGNIFQSIPLLLKKIEPIYVVICTHGLKGLFQHIFGAHILKLVQAISYSCIVLQENNKTNLSEIKSILMPIGPHPDFDIKINTSAKISKELNAPITIYEIDRVGLDLGNQFEVNKEKTKAYFIKNQVKHTKILDELKVVSAGFSRQTIDYAKSNNYDLISLMSTISKNDILFGIADKENFLINAAGIPILCCH